MIWDGGFWTEIIRLANRLFSAPSKEIKKVVKIYDAMHKVLDETEVQRFLIFRAHNGGGLIRPNTPLYVSVIHEDYSTPFKSVKDAYQELQVDSEYIRMLDAICENKSVALKIENMKAGLLKNIYAAEGVRYSEIYYLGQNRKNLYFCSLGCAWENGWEDSVKQKLAINLAVNEIRNNIM